MHDPNIWNQVLIWPILNIMIGFYKLFELLGAPGPLGFAIIAMTAVMRLILSPLMHAQMVSAKKMQKIKPKLDELGKIHKEDKAALQKAQLALYQEHGINPAAGCVPLLIQLPVLIAMYNVFQSLLQGTNPAELMTTINKVLYFPFLHLTKFDMSFLGFDLLTKPGQWQTHGLWLITIPVITAGLQWYQTKLMMQPQESATKQSKPIAEELPEKTKKKQTKQNEIVAPPTVGDKKPEQSQDDMMADMQKQMSIISPLMFGYFAFQFPIGLALYWNVFSLFGIMHQRGVNAKHG